MQHGDSFELYHYSENLTRYSLPIFWLRALFAFPEGMIGYIFSKVEQVCSLVEAISASSQTEYSRGIVIKRKEEGYQIVYAYIKGKHLTCVSLLE